MSDSNNNTPVADIPYGMGKKTLSAYLVGFLLSLLVTVIAFGAAAVGSTGVEDLGKWRSYLAMGATKVNETHIYIILAVLAVVQLYIQVICFLRMNARKEGFINTMSFLFAIFVVFVVVGGSYWIMWNLNYNMMH